MNRCFRLYSSAVGVMVALGTTGCGSMSKLAGGKTSHGAGPASGSLASFVAAVDVKKGTITFQSDKASTAGKARVAAQQYGPADRLQLSGTAAYSAGVLSGSVQLVSSNAYPLHDVRVVVTSISDSSVSVANADGTSSLTGTNRPYWDHGSLDPNAPSTKTWAFNNAGAVNFSFRVTVFANAWNYSLGDSNPNISISFPDAMHGWMVGTGGKLLSTKDGGATWQPQNVATGAQLEGVFFANQFDGWVVGTAGTIRRTGDGGRTWFAQTSGTTLNLHALHFVSPSTGWIVGDNGLILKTTNAGSSWSGQPTPRDVILDGVGFADANNGWAVGQDGVILHTTDGGGSWSQQTLPGDGTTYPLLGISVVDATHAWISGGQGHILRTTNGLSWTDVSTGVAAAMDDIFFLNTTTGWAVGGTGLILKTTDGGNNWTAQDSGTTVGLFFIRFTDANNGWTVGQSGTILHTTDGGASWSSRQQGSFSTQYSVDFPDVNHGWIVGDGGIIRVTTDAGQTWSYQSGNTSSILFCVRFADNQNGWAVGQSGTITHTTDGGATWTVQASGTGQTLLGIDCLDATHACVVGNGGVILYTADGGNNWQAMTSPVASPLASVDMVDADTIYASGNYGTIVASFDASLGANASWDRQNVPYGDHLNVIRMLDAGNGWALGQNGRILHLENGTWVSQREENGKYLYGGDFAAIPVSTPDGQPQNYKYVGWACGEGGRMLRTTDGGATWKRIDIGTINNLRSFRFTGPIGSVNPDSGWVVGAFGTVERLN